MGTFHLVFYAIDTEVSTLEASTCRYAYKGIKLIFALHTQFRAAKLTRVEIQRFTGSLTILQQRAVTRGCNT